MTDVPNAQEGGQPEDPAGQLGQDDIDALLNQASSGDQTPDGTGQADAGGPSTPDQSPAPATPANEISQEDIDALFGDSGSPSPEASSGDTGASAGGTVPGEAVSQADIDAILAAAGSEMSEAAGEPETAEPEVDERVDSMGRPFDEAAAAMQAAIEEEAAAKAAAEAAKPAPPPPPDARPFEMSEFTGPSDLDVNVERVSMLNDVNLNVKIELGSTRMLVEEVLALGDGSVVELDKLAGDPVDVYVNERLVARGEVLVLNDSFCVRISEVLAHDPHRVSI